MAGQSIMETILEIADRQPGLDGSRSDGENQGILTYRLPYQICSAPLYKGVGLIREEGPEEARDTRLQAEARRALETTRSVEEHDEPEIPREWKSSRAATRCS